MSDSMTLPKGDKKLDQLAHLAQKNISIFSLGIALFAILAALLVGAGLIALDGINPWEAYGYLLKGTFGNLYGFGETLTYFVPILFTGLSFSIAYKSGFFNIGAQGQFIMGGLGAVLVGVYIKGLPPVLHITLAMLAGFAAGALWAYIAGFLKISIGANELINTMMLNYVADLLVQFLVQGPIKDPGGSNFQSSEIQKSAALPLIIPGTRVNLGFVFALLAVFAFYYFMWRTPWGFQLRSIGSNSRAASFAGMNIVVGTIVACVVSGGFSGLGGAIELLGNQHRILEGFESGYGFDGIGAAVMGQHHPIGIVLSALLFAVIRTGTGAMQRDIGVPLPLLSVIQGLIIIMVVASAYITNRLTTATIGGRA